MMRGFCRYLRRKLAGATATPSPDDVIIHLYDVIIIVHVHHGHAAFSAGRTSYLVT